jgi:hypothetical protein
MIKVSRILSLILYLMGQEERNIDMKI